MWSNCGNHLTPLIYVNNDGFHDTAVSKYGSIGEKNLPSGMCRMAYDLKRKKYQNAIFGPKWLPFPKEKVKFPDKVSSEHKNTLPGTNRTNTPPSLRPLPLNSPGSHDRWSEYTNRQLQATPLHGIRSSPQVILRIEYC